ncbi:ATP-dependent helicase, partial [Bacillus altitudinis]|uniref:ATP-dependent helicase n=1 Tax=Bacillus altitudinis TaxID=293387 RepID=UPI001643BE93
RVEYELIEVLGGEWEEVFCVGDDDEGMYGFRGRNGGFIVELKEEYRSAEMVDLDGNYCCDDRIVGSGEGIIKKKEDG